MADADELIQACATERDGELVDEAITLLSQYTDMGRDDIRAQVQQRRIEGIEIKHIERVVAPNGSAKEYRFYLDVWGKSAKFYIEPSDLVNDRVFREKILACTDTLLEPFDDWEGRVNQYFHENEVTPVDPEPIENVHEAAEAVLTTLQAKTVVEDREIFKNSPGSNLYLEDDGETLLVPGQVIDDACNRCSGDVEKRKLREEIDDFLTGNTKNVRFDDDFQRVWQFSHSAVTDIVDLHYNEDVTG